MKTFAYLLAAFLLTFLVVSSCKNKPVEQRHNHSLELNNGQKWKVVPEMMGIIHDMEVNLETHSTNADSLDYDGLGLKLQQGIDSLTQNCTMKGEAHDELHKWLVPYMELVEEFNAAEDELELNDLYQKLKESFIRFNTYFQ
jgi:hypothetical protein